MLAQGLATRARTPVQALDVIAFRTSRVVVMDGLPDGMPWTGSRHWKLPLSQACSCTYAMHAVRHNSGTAYDCAILCAPEGAGPLAGARVFSTHGDAW